MNNAVVGYGCGRAVLLGVILFGVLPLSCVGLFKLVGKKPPEPDQEPVLTRPVIRATKPVIAVHAADILAEFKAHTPRAAEKYKGNRVRVTGLVTSFTSSTVTLESFPAITCFFRDKSQIAKIDDGDTITVEGEVSSIANSLGIHLRNVTLLD